MSELIKSDFIKEVEIAARQKFENEPLVLRLDGIWTDVIGKIGNVLPNDAMLDWFTSNPNSTGKVNLFPYFRVDTALIAIDAEISNLPLFDDVNVTKEVYQKITMLCAQTLVWVDVGFTSFHDLVSFFDASENWTGLDSDSTNLDKKIKETADKANMWLCDTVKSYVQARQKYGQEFGLGNEDPFHKYCIEYLLEQRLNPQE